jgi:hypothetical protein
MAVISAIAEAATAWTRIALFAPPDTERASLAGFACSHDVCGA